jgi:phospholipid-binding lipoprotein MlaA
MRLRTVLSCLAGAFFLAGCMHKGTNPEDPYESTNRKIHNFNMAVDSALLKPAAKIYKGVLPAPIRSSINNFYNNIYMIPTVANDLLQADWHSASDDAGRFVINSTVGLGGLFDVAAENNLPLHRNDLGLTFARWGDKKSPYIVIPLLGPSTIRDGMGMLFEYTFLTPYPYIDDNAVLYSLIGVRYVDLRSQLLDSEQILNEAIDKYSLIRDAYLQNRNYLITGEKPQDDNSDPLYVDNNPEPEKKPSNLILKM